MKRPAEGTLALRPGDETGGENNIDKLTKIYFYFISSHHNIFLQQRAAGINTPILYTQVLKGHKRKKESGGSTRLCSEYLCRRGWTWAVRGTVQGHRAGGITGGGGVIRELIYGH